MSWGWRNEQGAEQKVPLIWSRRLNFVLWDWIKEAELHFWKLLPAAMLRAYLRKGKIGVETVWEAKNGGDLLWSKFSHKRHQTFSSGLGKLMSWEFLHYKEIVPLGYQLTPKPLDLDPFHPHLVWEETTVLLSVFIIWNFPASIIHFYRNVFSHSGFSLPPAHSGKPPHLKTLCC